MVSTGDTVISLHTRSPDQLPKFSFSEGGTPDQLKVPRSAQMFIWGEGGVGYSRLTQTQLKVPRSTQIFIFRGGGRGGGWGYFRPIHSNSKCQGLPKFSLGEGTPDYLKFKVPRSTQIFIYGEGEGDGGTSDQFIQTQSAKVCPNFHWGGGGYSRPTSTQSAKICSNLHFPGGGGTPDQHSWNTWVGHSWNFEPNFQSLQLATASQIVSHILLMWRLMRALHSERVPYWSWIHILHLQCILSNDPLI